MNKSCIKKYLASAFILAVFAGLLVLLFSACQVVKINTSECLASEAMVLNKVHCEVPQ